MILMTTDIVVKNIYEEDRNRQTSDKLKDGDLYWRLIFWQFIVLRPLGVVLIRLSTRKQPTDSVELLHSFITNKLH